MEWMTELIVVSFQYGKEVSLITKTSSPALWPTQLPIQWVLGGKMAG